MQCFTSPNNSFLSDTAGPVISEVIDIIDEIDICQYYSITEQFILTNLVDEFVRRWQVHYIILKRFLMQGRAIIASSSHLKEIAENDESDNQ